ncbi:unnamed protein product [Paramecium pentaurelia]|uniref:Uncharacterized protein n=1 Tax=Paramecium pentaurelia TaxID=43138 RepID=A0A8S1WNB9_9CILI|nr:unnamed protein product [Paramecium pentaurelia]
MSFNNSSANNSSFFSQTSLKYIETYYDEELEQQELEEEKQIFAQMFQTHYNTTSLFIQTVQESDISKQTKKLRILKRKLRKLMRKQISRGSVVKDQGQGGSNSTMTQLNQSKNYPDNEGPDNGIIGNNYQKTDNQENTIILEPIINPDIISISSISD